MYRYTHPIHEVTHTPKTKLVFSLKTRRLGTFTVRAPKAVVVLCKTLVNLEQLWFLLLGARLQLQINLFFSEPHPALHIPVPPNTLISGHYLGFQLAGCVIV